MNTPRKKTMDGLGPSPKKKSPTVLASSESSSTGIVMSKRKLKKKKVSVQDFSSHSQFSKNKNPHRFNQYKEKISAQWYWLQYLLKFGILTIAVVIFLNAQTHSEIRVNPHQEYFSLDDTVIASVYPNQQELAFDIIAIHHEEKVPVISEGVRPVARSAQGIVTVYNYYSGEPQRLLPNTRFESAGGLIFMMDENPVIIPGKIGEVPGELTLTVYAQNPGPQYNIEPTDFTLPGYQEAGLTDKYNNIYASSENSMEGGYVGSEAYISDDQLARVGATLQNTLKERLEFMLKNEKTERALYVEGSARIRYAEPEFMFTESGTEGSVSQRGTIVALVVSSDDLARFIEQKYLSVEGEAREVVDTLLVQLLLESQDFNFDTDTRASISLKGSSLLSWIIDTEALKQELMGKKLQEIPAFFEQTRSIQQARISVNPFWKNRVSRILEDIKVYVD